MTRVYAALLLVLCTGCIMQVTTQAAPPEQRVPVPDKLKADKAPDLVDTGVEGCKQAPSLDPNLYYCAKEEQWFRYSMNRWYLAFAWDGNWFPVSDKELPAGLVQITPAPEEVKKSRAKRLEELDKELEKIDETPETPDDAKSREEKLKQLEKQLEELDEQEAPQGAD